MNRSKLIFSEFALSWLRGYDFGPQHPEIIKKALSRLEDGPLVERWWPVSHSDKIDEIDRDLFDIRYQERSKLVRVVLHSSRIKDTSLALEAQKLNCPLHATLLLDLESKFGVFTLSTHTSEVEGIKHFETEDLSFLCQQWLLPKDSKGNELTLSICLPQHEGAQPLYIREVMNFYFLNLHQAFWQSEWKKCWPQFETISLDLADETYSQGCQFLRELREKELIKSSIPTSFGLVFNVWNIEGIRSSSFRKDKFCEEYEPDLCYLLTDGRSTSFDGAPVEQGANPETLVFLTPNHAIYINQATHLLSPDRVHDRLSHYYVLDVEFLRLVELLTLQYTICRTYDLILDDKLAGIEALDAEDPKDVLEVIKLRRHVAHSIRRFDPFNFLNSAHWEPLYARLLANRQLDIGTVRELLMTKLNHLDDEISQAMLLQERNRQREEREQELDVLRNLHSLSLASETQSDALMIINFVVSATASFTFTQVLVPWLTRCTGVQSSFDIAFPRVWVALNVAVFVLVATALYALTTTLIRRRKPVVEFEGVVDNRPYEDGALRAYVRSRSDLEYMNLNTDENSGYLRIRKKKGIVLLQFKGGFIRRYIVFAQGIRDGDLDRLKREYVDAELDRLP